MDRPRTKDFRITKRMTDFEKDLLELIAETIEEPEDVFVDRVSSLIDRYRAKASGKHCTGRPDCPLPDDHPEHLR